MAPETIELLGTLASFAKTFLNPAMLGISALSFLTLLLIFVWVRRA